MSARKKQIREDFRSVCLKRDNYKCKACNFKPEFDEELDVHHITDRTEMPNGGYVKENGISLCSECHLKAETFHVSKGKVWNQNMHPSDLYIMIGSSKEKAIEASHRL